MRGAGTFRALTLALIVSTIGALGTVGNAVAGDQHIVADRQAYAATTPVDPYNKSAIAMHVGNGPTGATHVGYVHLNLDSLAPGVILHNLVVTFSPFDTTASNQSEVQVNAASAIVHACMLVEEMPKTFDPSKPPKEDCTKGDVVGHRTQDGRWQFDFVSMAARWLGSGNTGAAILPLPGNPDASYQLDFDKSLTEGFALFTPAPTKTNTGQVPLQAPQDSTSTSGSTSIGGGVIGAPPDNGTTLAPASPQPQTVTVPPKAAPSQNGPTSGGGGIPLSLLVLGISVALAVGLMAYPVSQALHARASGILPGLLGQVRAHRTAFGVTSVLLVWSVAYTSYQASHPNSGEAAFGGQQGGGTAQAGPGATPSGDATPGAGSNAPAPLPNVAGSTKKFGRTNVLIPDDGVPVASLFSPAEDRIGITSSSINFCAHAALTYADAFQTSPDDFNVFWSNLNDHGGIHNRKVSETYINDNYEPTTAVQAANQCKEQNPFMLLGGIGFDQIPAVRVWAQSNRMLYVHHVATENGQSNCDYCFAPLPSVEMFGKFFGELVAKKYPGKKVGIIWRQSGNWQPGRDVFKQVLSQHGMGLCGTCDMPVAKNQADYHKEIAALGPTGANVDVVFIWESALVVPEVVSQSHSQGWFPNFVVFPFNVSLANMTSADINPPIIGTAVWPAYTKGQYDGPFAPYAADIKEFERQYAQYRPNTRLDGAGGDLLFLNWVAQKALAAQLFDCGQDCTRNKMAGMMLAGYKKTVSPNCPGDWSRRSHYGSYGFDVTETTTFGATVGWKPTELCVEQP